MEMKFQEERVVLSSWGGSIKNTQFLPISRKYETVSRALPVQFPFSAWSQICTSFPLQNTACLSKCCITLHYASTLCTKLYLTSRTQKKEKTRSWGNLILCRVQQIGFLDECTLWGRGTSSEPHHHTVRLRPCPFLFSLKLIADIGLFLVSSTFPSQS